jgi:hypothetical protein
MMKKITLLIALLVVSFGYSQNLPFDFSNGNQLMTGDGGATTSIVQDAGNDVLEIVGATAPWDNAQIVFADKLDLSDDANNTITFRIKPVNGTGNGVHLLKFELPDAGSDQELEFTTTGTEWQNITLDFPSGLSNYGRMVIFTDKGDENAGVSDTYLVDDIAGAKHVTGTPPVVVLPFDFSNADQLMAGDGGATTSIVQDAGNDVLQLVGTTAPWDNAQINFTENVDLSDDANNTITFRIKPINDTGSGVHLLKFESPATGGDQELEFTTTGTEWQEISLDFGAGLSNYGKIVIFTDKGDDNAGVSDTYLIDDIALSSSGGGGPVVALPFDFSNADQLMTGDGGAATSIVQDAGNDVLQLVGATAPWDNAQINFTENVDLSDDANNTIQFKIKPVNDTGSGVHLIKFELPAAGGDQELEFTTTGTDWQTISLDFGAGLSNYGRIVIFTDKGDANAGVSDTYLIDDIELVASSGGGGGTSEGYCEKVVTHLGIAAEVASAIKLTIENSGEKTMKVTIESNDTDPVDEIVIPAVTGAPTVSAKDTSVAGKISVTLTWTDAPTTDIDINVLWSKASFAGNWQLAADPVTVKFDSSCATASVEDNNLLKISLYPNPTNNMLNISAKSTIKSAVIYNVLGKVVKNITINKVSDNIDVSSLNSGIYIIKYAIDNSVGTMKFIKE